MMFINLSSYTEPSLLLSFFGLKSDARCMMTSFMPLFDSMSSQKYIINKKKSKSSQLTGTNQLFSLWQNFKLVTEIEEAVALFVVPHPRLHVQPATVI